MNAPRGQVVAVSVARPRWHEMYGRQVFSSIVRDPAVGPVHFRPGGPDGNATAVHTEEVYACFAEHYDYWARELQVDRSEWRPCHWGENISLAGCPTEEALHVGDRFRIGEALLEVTSPRIPCFKLSWRLGQPESFLKALIESGKMGCYLRVLEPGNIGPGDELTRVHEARDAITVMELSKLLHDPSITDTSILRRVQATPGLGAQASEMLRKRISYLTDGILATRGRWTGWRRFVVTAIRSETEAIKSFWLKPADGGPIGGYRAGQFLAVKLPNACNSVTRTWSISHFDPDADSYRISIKRESNGMASGYMHDRLQVGDELEVRPPTGRFVLDRGSFLRTVLISAGVGVTPLLAMLRAHVERGDEAPPLLWLHAARSGGEHAFREEVQDLLARMPNASRRVFYDAPGPGDEVGRDFDRVGRVTREAVAELVTESYKLRPFGRELELTGDNADFYLCGPPGFEAVVREALLAHGVNPGAIRSESFSPNAVGHEKLQTPEQACVHFRPSGTVATWARDDDQTLLELAESCGLAVESGCRMGLCGSCEAGISAGEVGYVVEPAVDPAPGRVLLCCAQPLTDRVDLEI